MGKYKQAFLLKLAEINEYKFTFIARLIRPIITVSIFAIMYMEIFNISGKTEIAGLTKMMFLAYIILAVFQKRMVSPWTGGEQVWKDIKTGELTSFITKPVDYVKLQFSNTFANILMNALYSIVIFIIVSYIAHIFTGFYFPAKLILFLYYFISLFLSLILAHTFYFMVGTMTFWVGDVWSFIDVGNLLQQFLSGSLIPLSISATLLSISNFLPFKSMVFTPIMIYLGQYTSNEIFWQLGQQVIWCIILYYLAKFIFNKGLEKFEAQGG